MEINIRTVDQVAVVEIVGDIDGKTAPEAQKRILPLVQPGSKILLDMSQVSFMSSAGLRVLLSTYRQISSNQGQIVLAGLSDELEDTMTLTGFLRFFSAYDTIEEALASLR